MQIKLHKYGNKWSFQNIVLNRSKRGPVEIDFEKLTQEEQVFIITCIKYQQITADVNINRLYKIWAKNAPDLNLPCKNPNNLLIEQTDDDIDNSIKKIRKALKLDKEYDIDQLTNRCVSILSRPKRAILQKINNSNNFPLLNRLLECENMTLKRKYVITAINKRRNELIFDVQSGKYKNKFIRYKQGKEYIYNCRYEFRMVYKKYMRAKKEELKEIYSEESTIAITPEALAIALVTGIEQW